MRVLFILITAFIQVVLYVFIYDISIYIWTEIWQRDYRRDIAWGISVYVYAWTFICIVVLGMLINLMENKKLLISLNILIYLIFVYSFDFSYYPNRMNLIFLDSLIAFFIPLTIYIISWYYYEKKYIKNKG